MLIRKLRFSLAGMMVLVLVAALGLNEYRRRAAIREATIRRATVVLTQYIPNADLPNIEARVSTLSADRQFQRVEFTHRETKQTNIVTIPVKPTAP
jgi:hypothetical protein